MELDNEHDIDAMPISIERCRELLGEEAEALTDREVALIRRHAETMAYIVMEMYVDSRRIPE